MSGSINTPTRHKAGMPAGRKALWDALAECMRLREKIRDKSGRKNP